MSEMQTTNAWKVLDFLAELAADREAGRVRSLADYLAAYPSVTDEVAREYVRTINGQTDGDSTDGRLGPYRLVRELGRGGQGRVWLAIDERLDRRVALKLLRSGSITREATERLQREAMLASKLEHPGICPVFEVGQIDGEAFLAMRYVAGESLENHLESARTRSERFLRLAPGNGMTHATELVERVARAVHAAHEAGVVHRDIKPGNIMIGEDHEPIVLDFGVARDETGTQPTLSISSHAFGTPAYMSPEQLDAGSATTRHTDIWALGVVLQECLCLERPFVAATREGLYDAIRTRAPVDPRRRNPDIPAEFCAILAVALEKNPQRRYATAAEFADDLARARRREPIRASPPGPLRKTVRWVQRNRSLAASLGVAFLTLAIALTVTTLDRRRQTELRAFAEKQANDMRALSATYLYDLHDALHDLPGATLAKRRIAEKALAYLELLRDREHGSDVRSDVIAAHVRVGDVLGNGRFANLGETDKALAHYRSALEIARQLRDEQPGSARARLAVARCLARIGNVHETTGDATRAVEHYRRALPLTDGGATESRRLEIECHLDLGRAILLTESSRDASNSALATFATAEETATRLATAQPSQPDWRAIAAVARSWIGVATWNLGKSREAVSHFAHAKRELESLPAEFRRRLSVRHALCSCYDKLGKHALDTGKVEDARSLLERSIAVADSLVALDPHDQLARRRCAESHANQAYVFLHTGDHAKAQASFEHSLGLLENGPKPQRWERHSRAKSLVGIGATHYGRLELDRAIERFEEAHAITNALEREGQSDIDTKMTHAATQLYIAGGHRRQGKLDSAKLWYEKAQRSYDALHRRDPDNRTVMIARMVLFQNLAHLAVDSNHSGDAIELFERAIEIGERRRARFGDVDSVLALAILEQALGSALELGRRTDDARTTYTRAVRRFEEVLDADPTNHRARRNLARTLLESVRLEVIERDLAAALRGIEKTRGVATALQRSQGKRDPKTTLILASTWALEAIVANRQKETDRVREAIDKAQALLQGLRPEQRRLFRYRREMQVLRRRARGK